MAVEIEKRFLLKNVPVLEGAERLDIFQGYLLKDPEKVVRIRRVGDSAKITIKGKRIAGAASEYEYDIPVDDGDELLAMCAEKDTLRKSRYLLLADDGFTWEVDIFAGRLAGLNIAEIELPSIDTQFIMPKWFDGVDVTEDNRFASVALTQLDQYEVKALVNSVIG